MSIKLTGLDQQVKGSQVSIAVLETHPLIKLAQALPWEALAELVMNDLKSTTPKGLWMRGRALYLRVHLAVYILQKIFDKTDRAIGHDMQENAAYQVFAGSQIIPDWTSPHFTKVEEFRNRLSPQTQMDIANLISKVAVQMGFADPRKVDLDSTVQEANATYPSDARLMVQMAEKAAKVINWVKNQVSQALPSMPVIDLKAVKAAAKGYFFAAKNMAKEKKHALFAKLHAVVKKQFYQAEKCLQSVLVEHPLEMPWNIQRSYDQVFVHGRRYLLDVAHFVRTSTMKTGKRLSWHLDAIACIIKGKVGKAKEFGRVFQIGRIGGNFVFTYMLDSLHMSDKQAVGPLLAEHKKIFGPMGLQSFATDCGYYSIANETAALASLDANEHLHLGYPYEHVSDEMDAQLKDHRAGLEAVIGHVKHGGQLKRSRMKTDKATLAAGFAAMAGFNLRQLMRAQIQQERKKINVK